MKTKVEKRLIEAKELLNNASVVARDRIYQIEVESFDSSVSVVGDIGQITSQIAEAKADFEKSAIALREARCKLTERNIGIRSMFAVEEIEGTIVFAHSKSTEAITLVEEILTLLENILPKDSP